MCARICKSRRLSARDAEWNVPVCEVVVDVEVCAEVGVEVGTVGEGEGFVVGVAVGTVGEGDGWEVGVSVG